MPSLSRIRTKAALQNGRAAVTNALSTARSASTRWGRTSVLRIDARSDVLWTVIDTGSAGFGSDTVVLRRIDLRKEMGIDLESNRNALCFNSRGVGTTGAQCRATGAVIILGYGASADTLHINSAGRSWK